jgi:hypothetical protein
MLNFVIHVSSQLVVSKEGDNVTNFHWTIAGNFWIYLSLTVISQLTSSRIHCCVSYYQWNHISSCSLLDSILPIPMAVRTEAQVCGRSLAGITNVEFRWRCGCSSLNFVVYCLGRGLCNELISRLEESHRVCVCVCVCVWSRNHNNEAVYSQVALLFHRKRRRFISLMPYIFIQIQNNYFVG